VTTVAVIQARAGSSRLPGKVLADIGGQTMLAKVVGRVKRSRLVDVVLVATTGAREDDPVARIGADAGAMVHRGPVLDVLDRFVGALAPFADDDIVVRITADCPFVDPEIIDLCISRLARGDVEFVANRLPPPAVRTFPVGLDVEATRVGSLREAGQEATALFEREHVMPYLYAGTRARRVDVLDIDEDLSGERWTVDTPEDLEAVRAIDDMVGPEPFGWRDVLAVVRAHPELRTINGTGTQKRLDEVDERWSDSSRPRG
jgi:spore coat polysaccharide biosynthesis protein SpsF